MDRGFEFGGRKFQLRKIDAFRQFHVVRRIGPILSELLPVLKAGQAFNLERATEEQKLDALAKFATPIMLGFSKLSDADADYVLFRLLAAVEMQQSAGNWAPVATDTMLMIQDLELPAMLQLAGRAFMYNLSGFFAVLPQQSRAAGE